MFYSIKIMFDSLGFQAIINLEYYYKWSLEMVNYNGVIFQWLLKFQIFENKA